MELETVISHYGEDKTKYAGAVVPPIYQNSLFTFESWDAIDKAFEDPVRNSIYTRGNNPSVSMYEKKIAKIVGCESAKLFASGMGAISSAIMHFVKNGDHIITVTNVYGPANNFMNVYLKEKCGVETTFISGCDIEEFKSSYKPNTTLIYLESPSSTVFSMQDIKAVADFAKSKGIKTIIDNTWATPIFQKPLDMGVDIEVHSCSKYLGGHSDTVAGLLLSNQKTVDSVFLKEHALFGAKMAPFEAWLLLRSLRTLPIRMKAHEYNGIKVAEYLEKHPKIKRTLHPALKSHPQYELGKKQMTGYASLFAFEIDSENVDKIKAFVNSLEYFCIGVSWGGHESLIYAPAISYLKELPKERFKSMGISIGMMRVSIGLENPDDLIKDLDNALKNI